jgi:hypothetical protein
LRWWSVANTHVPLILQRASVSRPSGQWRDDDCDVLENGVVVGRILNVPVAPEVAPGCGRVATTATYAALRIEPPRVCRRPFGLSHAAMAGFSNMA